jgi:hypothetical protein
VSGKPPISSNDPARVSFLKRKNEVTKTMEKIQKELEGDKLGM